MFESWQALRGGQGKNRFEHGSRHTKGEIYVQTSVSSDDLHRPDSNFMEGGGVTKADIPNKTQAKDKPGTHTFGKIGSKILVQFVKMGFGDDNGVQRRIIGTLVRGASRLECAVLIAGNSRISSRGW